MCDRGIGMGVALYDPKQGDELRKKVQKISPS